MQDSHPRYVLLGGRRRQLLLKKQYRPTAMATAAAFWPCGTSLRRSPRMQQSAWIIVYSSFSIVHVYNIWYVYQTFPPRIMFWLPIIKDFRETLFPVFILIWVSWWMTHTEQCPSSAHLPVSVWIYSLLWDMATLQFVQSCLSLWKRYFC